MLSVCHGFSLLLLFYHYCWSCSSFVVIIDIIVIIMFLLLLLLLHTPQSLNTIFRLPYSKLKHCRLSNFILAWGPTLFLDCSATYWFEGLHFWASSWFDVLLFKLSSYVPYITSAKYYYLIIYHYYIQIKTFLGVYFFPQSFL